MSGKEEFVTMAVKVPEKVVKIVRDILLIHEEITEEEYWSMSIIQRAVADTDAIYTDPTPVLKRYGLLKYRDY